VALNSECDIRVKPQTCVAALASCKLPVNTAPYEELRVRDNGIIRLYCGRCMQPLTEIFVSARLVSGSEKNLERRLAAEQVGDLRFDLFTRGRYSTDASHYQIMPLGVVAPRTLAETERALAVCRSEAVPLTPRGGGTSQAGQTINKSLIIDCSRYLNRIVEIDAEGRRCIVEPGIVLDELNRALKPAGLWFPVDVSTASRATIGGMVGNNSCGARRR
jgi:hypothetical protein